MCTVRDSPLLRTGSIAFRAAPVANNFHRQKHRSCFLRTSRPHLYSQRALPQSVKFGSIRVESRDKNIANWSAAPHRTASAAKRIGSQASSVRRSLNSSCQYRCIRAYVTVHGLATSRPLLRVIGRYGITSCNGIV